MKLLKPLLGTLLIAGLLSVNSANAGAVLDKIMSSKTIKIATDANWPPQSFINDDNKMDGFDVDVAREIAKRLGAEVEFITPNWDVITAGNWYGRWDMHVGSMTPTKQRAESFVFPCGLLLHTGLRWQCMQSSGIVSPALCPKRHESRHWHWHYL